MTNLTVVIDDDVLRAARIKALQQGTSVNEICREAIARFAAPVEGHEEFMTQLRALSTRMRAAPDALPMWPSRDAMYEEGMAERMPTLWATMDGKPAPKRK